MAPRGSYKALDLGTKVQILKKVKAGASKSTVADQYGIKRNTLSTYLKNEEAIMKSWEHERFSSKRKRMRTAAHQDVEQALILWMKEARQNNYPISGPILQAKAEDLALRLDAEGFRCSEGWLRRFRDRYGIVYRTICGESASVPDSECEDWKNRLCGIIEGYSPADIFNADETGIFYKLLPNKTLAFKDEDCAGGKQSKLRVTVLLTANADGSEKLKPLVIGKSKNPRCFKGIKTLPVEYKSSKKAWINSDIFTGWLRDLDNSFQLKKRKVVLFVDNASAHEEIKDLKAIKLVFLPPNTTSKLQPMDQGVIKNFKVFYRKRLLQRLLLCMDCEKDYDVTLLSALNFIYSAWEDVKPQTIANCFRHCGFKFEKLDLEIVNDSEPAAEVEKENPCPDSEWWKEGTFAQYVSVDDGMDVCGSLTDNDIVKMVLQNSEKLEESEDEGEPEIVPPSEKAIFDSIECLRNFILCQKFANDEFKYLQRIEDLAIRSKASRQKQTKITNFFQ